MKKGRPFKYNHQNLRQRYKDLLITLSVKLGRSPKQEEIIKNLGISRSTLWKIRQPFL